MRALPVIVDMFVLLTMLAFVMFFAALGNSAPNEPAKRLAFVEVEATLELANASAPAASVATFRGELIDASGNPTTGSVIARIDANEKMMTFLIRDAPDEARLRVVLDEISPQAFDGETFRFHLKRQYPGPPAAREFEEPVGQAPLADLPLTGAL